MRFVSSPSLSHSCFLPPLYSVSSPFAHSSRSLSTSLPRSLAPLSRSPPVARSSCLFSPPSPHGSMLCVCGFFSSSSGALRRAASLVTRAHARGSTLDAAGRRAASCRCATSDHASRSKPHNPPHRLRHRAIGARARSSAPRQALRLRQVCVCVCARGGCFGPLSKTRRRARASSLT